MKKLLIIILVLLPLFCLSQKSGVVRNSGDTIVGYIRYSTGKMIVFYDKIKSINSDRIPWVDVSAVIGNLERIKMNAVSKNFPGIKFFPNYKVPLPKSSFNSKGITVIYGPTGGDLIRQSGILRLSSLGVGILTATLVGIGADEWKSQQTAAVGVIGAALALNLYVFGEINLIRAGKKLNQDAISLGFADQGIGIALKF